MIRASHIMALLLCASLIFSQEQRQMHFSARKAILAADDGLMELTGDVSIELITFNLLADAVQIRGSNYRTLNASGSVRVTKSTENTHAHMLKANQLHYNQQTKVLRMWGEVNFTDENDGITILASVLNYDEAKQEWRFEGDVKINSKDFSAQSLVAVFYEETNQLELIGQATLVLSEGNQRFTAEQIHFNTTTQVLQMEHVNNGSINYTAPSRG